MVLCLVLSPSCRRQFRLKSDFIIMRDQWNETVNDMACELLTIV
jgi:hypothetical protein